MTEEDRPKKAKWELTPEAFEKLLCWLSEDRDMAGKEYESIRKKLVRHFSRKGCADPGELFDITINRVAKKLDEGLEDAIPLRYCFGVAKKIWQEHIKQLKPDPLPEPDRFPDPHPNQGGNEQESRCLDACLTKLPPNSRDLITRYYQGQGREKIEARKALAMEHGGEELLRIKAFRIRSRLRVCIEDCVQRIQ